MSHLRCDKCQTAWNIAIEALVTTKGVYPVDYSLPLYVRTDACCDGLGAYLFQIVETEDISRTRVRAIVCRWHPLCDCAPGAHPPGKSLLPSRPSSFPGGPRLG